MKLWKKKGFLDWYTSPAWHGETAIDALGAESKTIAFHKESIPRTRMGIKIEISSMEDEWFKVITTNIDLKVSVSSREPSYHSVDQKYYLCDQFDGLLKLLSVI